MGGQLVGKIRVRIETAEKALDDKEMELLEQIKKSKENQLMRGVNLCSQSQFNKLDKLMNEHEKHKEEEMKSLKSHSPSRSRQRLRRMSKVKIYLKNGYLVICQFQTR